jgi:hypothetical protein
MIVEGGGSLLLVAKLAWSCGYMSWAFVRGVDWKKVGLKSGLSGLGLNERICLNS